MFLPKNIQDIFITGGAGFIGSQLADKLAIEQKQITVFDNLSSGKRDFLKQNLNRENFHLVVGDLLEIEQLEEALSSKIDIVFHLAANPDIAKGIKDPTLDFNQTIVATFNLLQVMKKKGIKKLVYLSGSGVYGDVGTMFTAENFGPLLPVSMYGASKLSAEGLISAFAHLYHIQSWIFRPANIIGSRATHGVVFDFINKLKVDKKKLLILGDGQQSKSYLYVSDVLDAISLGLTSGKELVSIFNIASKTYITVNEIADIVIKKMNLRNVTITHTKGKIGWPGDVPMVRIENKKLESFGWSVKYTSRQAVERAIEELLEDEK